MGGARASQSPGRVVRDGTLGPVAKLAPEAGAAVISAAEAPPVERTVSSDELESSFSPVTEAPVWAQRRASHPHPRFKERRLSVEPRGDGSSVSSRTHFTPSGEEA